MLANNGILDAYNLLTGTDVYRRRLPYIGSGFSASPVAADGKIYLSSEDGKSDTTKISSAVWNGSMFVKE